MNTTTARPRVSTSKKTHAIIASALSRFGAMTTDETAWRLNMPILSIRPRFSEMHAEGLIKKTGKIRRNHTGKPAHVWALTQQGLDSLQQAKE